MDNYIVAQIDSQENLVQHLEQLLLIEKSKLKCLYAYRDRIKGFIPIDSLSIDQKLETALPDKVDTDTVGDDSTHYPNLTIEQLDRELEEYFDRDPRVEI